MPDAPTASQTSPPPESRALLSADPRSRRERDPAVRAPAEAPEREGGEPLAPSTFLYVAERRGLIQPIDCWVVGKAIAMIAEHQRAGRRLVLHVNLSGKYIGNPQVTGFIENALAGGRVDPSCLIFEVTETAAIANIEEAKTFVRRLHARGCQLALDDFGSGSGSFFNIKTLPFDYLKIDGDFIRGIGASATDQLVVRPSSRSPGGSARKRSPSSY